MFWGTDAPVITCFTWQIQSEMTHEVQPRQTRDPASLLSFWHHLILYSFILPGPRCFLLVRLSYFHIWEQQRPLLAFLNSLLSRYPFTWFCEVIWDFIKQTGSINNMEVSFQKGNYGLRFVTLNPLRSLVLQFQLSLDKQDVTYSDNAITFSEGCLVSSKLYNGYLSRYR